MVSSLPSTKPSCGRAATVKSRFHKASFLKNKHSESGSKYRQDASGKSIRKDQSKQSVSSKSGGLSPKEQKEQAEPMDTSMDLSLLPTSPLVSDSKLEHTQENNSSKTRRRELSARLHALNIKYKQDASGETIRKDGDRHHSRWSTSRPHALDFNKPESSGQHHQRVESPPRSVPPAVMKLTQGHIVSGQKKRERSSSDESTSAPANLSKDHDAAKPRVKYSSKDSKDSKKADNCAPGAKTAAKAKAEADAENKKSVKKSSRLQEKEEAAKVEAEEAAKAEAKRVAAMRAKFEQDKKDAENFRAKVEALDAAKYKAAYAAKERSIAEAIRAKYAENAARLANQKAKSSKSSV